MSACSKLFSAIAFVPIGQEQLPAGAWSVSTSRCVEANGQAAKISGGEISDHICLDCIAILAPILGGDHRRADLRPSLACIEECGCGRAVFLGDTFSNREITIAAGATLIGAAVGCGDASFMS